MQLIVVTYNVAHCVIPETGKISYDFYGKVIKSLGGDLVFLQEVNKKDSLDQPRELASRAGYPYVSFGRTAGMGGNAILSKYPLSEKVITQLGRIEGQAGRTMVSATVTGAAGKFRVGSTHAGGTKDGLVQVKAIKAEVTKYSAFLLGGDFNFEPTTEQGRYMDEFMNWVRPSGIDNVAYRGRFQVLSWQKVEDGNGDHDPIVVVLETDLKARQAPTAAKASKQSLSPK